MNTDNFSKCVILSTAKDPSALRLILPIIFALFICGCASDNADLSLEHSIRIPKEFSQGRGNPHVLSSADRFIDAYDRGWWSCVENYAADIQHRSTVGDRAGNGWGEAVAGWEAGYMDAKSRIKHLVGKYGEAPAQAFLKKSLEPPQ